MKRRLLLCAMLVTAPARIASAYDAINIAWDYCLGDGGGLLKTSTCATNLGSSLLVLSYTPGASLAGYVGVLGFVDIYTQGPLPPWWGGGCTGRTPAQALGTNAINTGCSNDPYGGGFLAAGGTVVISPRWNGANSIQLEFVYYNPPGMEVPMLAGEEWFVGNMTLSNMKSSGAGACAGCAIPACISFSKATIDRVEPPYSRTVTHGGTQPWVYWQQASGQACLPTPARRPTWGAIKALYR